MIRTLTRLFLLFHKITPLMLALPLVFVSGSYGWTPSFSFPSLSLLEILLLSFVCLFILDIQYMYLFQYKVLVSQEVQIKTLLYSTLHVHVAHSTLRVLQFGQYFLCCEAC